MGIKRRRLHITHANRGRWCCLTCNGWIHDRKTLAQHTASGHQVIAAGDAAAKTLSNMKRRNHR